MKPKDSSSNDNNAGLPPDSVRNLIRQTFHDALQLRRQAIVFAAARQMHSVFQELGIQFQKIDGLEEQGWIKIESLSRLRAIVGGRFKNLKDKWVAAGFPLREHRGDRVERGVINSEGWLELASWIARQGCEVRLAGENDDWLFEIRSQNRSNQ